MPPAVPERVSVAENPAKSVEHGRDLGGQRVVVAEVLGEEGLDADEGGECFLWPVGGCLQQADSATRFEQ